MLRSDKARQGCHQCHGARRLALESRAFHRRKLRWNHAKRQRKKRKVKSLVVMSLFQV